MSIMSEIFTVEGTTDGSSATDDFLLYSDAFYTNAVSTTPLYIRIPAGTKLKIWSRRVNCPTQNTELVINYTHDVTAAVPTWVEVNRDIQDVSVETSFDKEKRRPIVLRGFTGKEAVKFTWNQSAAAVAYFNAELEFAEDE